MVKHVPELAAHFPARAEYPELFGYRLGFLGIATQTKEGRMEPRYKIPQSVRGIAVRIHRNEKHLDPFGLGTQRLHHRGEAGKRQRADIRARGIPEKNYDNLALEIAKRTNLCIMIAQRELARECGSGQIRVAKLHGDPVAGHRKQAENCKKEVSIHGIFLN